ncbi:type II secretion system protein M [Pseudomonas stutzeri]|uniref:MSHA biogenesis protein MshJ n=1 Tax=Stutzerimonas stutzeri TaxID=316 RepID=A0A2N8S608_STUST|nr:type II secretion system protein GspM [Stutzerimonas stutzeri]MCQ4297049.1 type II secretion system protein M [Stutzerimonas stutzeri]PNF82060.1 MSHA biogenesis protein MshJ [Stutzerimonas stutzeri]
MSSALDLLRQRWGTLAPREQWLSMLVGAALLGMLYLMLVAEPLAQRIAQQDSQRQLAEARRLEASNALLELQARLAADPNRPYLDALDAAKIGRERILHSIDEGTSSLISPARMKALLQDLLRRQPRLQMVGLQSFSAPLELPAAPSDTASAAASPTVGFYRHGVRLTLQGGYFDLLDYLQTVQNSGWRLHWDSLDYHIEEAGPDKARITLELHTLSRDAGWVGV